MLTEQKEDAHMVISGYCVHDVIPLVVADQGCVSNLKSSGLH